MDITQILVLVVIGIGGGAWNAVAGGASLLTFPALMAAGLPPVVANATNFLGLLPSNAAALPAYREELRGLGRELRPLILVSGAGAIVGSLLLVVSDPQTFVALIPALIFTATLLFAFGDKVRALLLSSGQREDKSGHCLHQPFRCLHLWRVLRRWSWLYPFGCRANPWARRLPCRQQYQKSAGDDLHHTEYRRLRPRRPD